MRRAFLVPLLVVALAHAGFRGPGEYSGVVIRDRWGGCYLYSGVYLTYISNDEKLKLDDAVGRAVVIDARDVRQPINPGDALVRKLTLLNREPSEDEWVPVHDIRMEVMPEFGGDREARFTIRIQNAAQRETRLVAGALGPTLLARRPSECSILEPSDGPSFALITRQTFWGSEGAVTSGRACHCGVAASWVLENGGFDAPLVMLESGEAREFTIRLELPPGEYEFLAG